MFTPQEIQEQTFSKAVFGGYDMQQVDDFLEPLTEDYIMLYKENSVLKSKMKVLVEKLEEYRGQEAAMKQQMAQAQAIRLFAHNLLLRHHLRGRERQVSRLELFQQLEMSLDVMLDHVDEIERSLLRIVEPRLLFGKLLFEIVALRAERRLRACDNRCAARLRLCDHAVALRLRLRHLLLHRSFLPAVFLELFDQDLHLGLDAGKSENHERL